VLRDDATLEKLPVGGEKAAIGDLAPAIARRTCGEDEARDAPRAEREGREVGAAAGDTETDVPEEEEEEDEELVSGHLARTLRGALAWD
jgi:hypothetical protein